MSFPNWEAFVVDKISHEKSTDLFNKTDQTNQKTPIIYNGYLAATATYNNITNYWICILTSADITLQFLHIYHEALRLNIVSYNCVRWRVTHRLLPRYGSSVSQYITMVPTYIGHSTIGNWCVWHISDIDWDIPLEGVGVVRYYLETLYFYCPNTLVNWIRQPQRFWANGLCGRGAVVISLKSFRSEVNS